MSTRRRAALVGTLVLTSALAASSPRALAQSAGDPAAALPAPPLTLSVTPAAGGGPWTLKVENTGDVPVRIAADPRLLVLEVTPPAGFVDEAAAAKAKASRRKPEVPKTLRCELPADTRPSSDDGHELVVPAKRSWSQPFDPLFYCFGARERAMLVTGATVKAHFGWPVPQPKPTTRGRTKPATLAAPFVATPVGAAIGKVAPAKELEAAPFTLVENANGATTPSPASPSGLSIALPTARDVYRGAEIATTVTVTNDGDKAVYLLFRPETLLLTVAGPSGSVSCDTTRPVDAPIRELYPRLGPGSRTSLTLLLDTMCPADTFDTPGIYRVTPGLDTTNASARSIGLKSWDGTATGASPMLLRVRAPRRPAATTTRPALD
jgi:hypothetical protein